MADITTSITMNADLWKEARKRSIDLDIEIARYLEALISADLATAAAQQNRPLPDFIMLAAYYGHLVRTYGPKQVRQAHHRYLVRKVVSADDPNWPWSQLARNGNIERTAK